MAITNYASDLVFEMAYFDQRVFKSSFDSAPRVSFTHLFSSIFFISSIKYYFLDYFIL